MNSLPRASVAQASDIKAYHAFQESHKTFAKEKLNLLPAPLLFAPLFAPLFALKPSLKAFFVIFAVLFALLASGSAFGSDTRLTPTESLNLNEKVAQVELIAASRAVPPSGDLLMGLRVQLAPGWKTYWRSPGDAGLAPRLIVSPEDPATGMSAPDNNNVKSVEMLWPLPERFGLFGIDTVGYSGGAKREVVFPLKVQVRQPELGLNWVPRFDLLLCSNICIPQTFLLSARLEGAGLGTLETAADPSPYAALLNAALESVPKTAGPTQPLQITDFHLEETAQDPYVVTTLKRMDRSLQEPDIFVEFVDGNGLLVPVGKPEIEFSDNGFTAQLRTPLLLSLAEIDLNERTLATLTARDGTAENLTGLEVKAPISPLQMNTQGVSTQRVSTQNLTHNFSLFFYLITALIGGLVLNVMPCVLPVLSLKLLSFVGDTHASSNNKGANSKGLFATAAGMILAFMGLAFALILIKSGGGLIGWGVQFQSPIFLIIMSLICIVMAMNLFDFFTLRLPVLSVFDRREAGQRGDTGRSASNGIFGHVGTGVIAALLSTPCSAPFVGVAAGFALTQNAATLLAVFFAMGIGFALPFLVAGAWPRAIRILPRPGPWMVTFRRIMVLPLLLLSVWLATLAVDQMRGAGGRDAQELVQKGWSTFEPDAIPALVADGQVVLVTLTADWCVTCKINKIRAYNDEEIITLLDDEQVIRQVGDWTRSDPKITVFLASHRRAGIPFDIVYGPKFPEGLILPEILAPTDIVNAIAAVQN